MKKNFLKALKKLPADKYRVDVVAPDLCDHAIQRLAPSLAAYKGCSIIDINPGVGLFSAKLHDILKPKSHILLEPKQTHYESFLKPFLDSPGSTYHVRDWPDEHRWSLANYRREGLIPPPGEAAGPISEQDPDTSTLIIANLATRGSSIGFGSKLQAGALYKALDFARNVAQSRRSSLERPPRMLLWMSDADKASILPRTVGGRGKLAAMLEENCMVEEVVGMGPPSRASRRENALDVQGRLNIAKKMKENGVLVPEGRGNPEDSAKLEDGHTSRDWHQELRELEDGFKQGKIAQFVGLPPGPIVQKKKGGDHRKMKPDKRIYSPEWTRLSELKRILKHMGAGEVKLDGLLRTQLEIDELNLSTTCDETLDGETSQAKTQEAESLTLELQASVSKLTAKQSSTLKYLSDDRRAFHMNPPLLLWDRRSAEPLIAQRDEFYAEADVALLDFRIREDVSPTSSSAEEDLYYETLCTALLSRGQATLKHLDTVALGGYKALVKNAPAVRDPGRGGRLDLESLRARTLTPEMLRQLAKAWTEWLFKPQLAEVLNQSEQGDLGLMKEDGPASR